MKKKLFYLASICIGLAFTACSSDDGGGTAAPVQTLTDVLLTNKDEAMTLSGLSDIDAPFEEIVFTDSIPYHQGCSKVVQLSVADMFADTIKRVLENKSISDQYIV